MEKDLEQKIQKRVHEIWEHEGRSGDPEDHWLRAEQEVRGTTAKGGGQGATTAEDKIIDQLGDFA
jgi:hypothetical protein